MTLPIKKVSELIDKHADLERDLSSSNLDSKSFAQKSKEYSNLNEIIETAKDYYNFEKNKKELRKIISESNEEKDIKELAKIELEELIKKYQVNENKLKIYLLPKDEAD